MSARGLAVAALLFGSMASAGPWVASGKQRGVVRFQVEGPLDDVIGETRQFNGTLDFTPEDWAKGTGVVAVPLATLQTGIDARDEDMRVEFLQTVRFPYAVLTIDRLSKPSTPSLKVGAVAQAEMSGTFEIHGVRRAIALPIRVQLDDEGHVTCSGMFEVALADYNIARPQRLFLKLGDTATASFNVRFTKKEPSVSVTVNAEPVKGAAAEPPPPSAPTVSDVKPIAAKPKPRPARKPKPELQYSFVFSGKDPKALGEKLFHSPTVGGEGNKVTCFHCHAKSDEREGFVLKDGFVRSANTLYNAAQRATFWGGFATNLGDASAICQKQYMRGSGLSDEQKEQLAAFITGISPDPAPAIDFKIAYSSMDTGLRDPTEGDVAKGKKLADRFCMTCHLDGRVGPVWAPGLYEPDWVVRRVRRLDGHQNKQMPGFTIVRLPDSDLRDIVTYLTSPKSEPPVFDRKSRGGGSKAGMP